MQIQHTVVFRLKHPVGSAPEKAFLEAALELASIPGVEDFRRFRQVSAGAPYTFGLSMTFADQATYDAYRDDPLHQQFVEQRWLPEVEAFQEIDYLPYP